jgi:aminoglycoside 6'-N-acetyltransferase
MTEFTFAFRPLTRDDFPLLSSWLAKPFVQRWWQHDPESVEADFGEGIDGIDPTEYVIASLDGHPIGLVQRGQVGDDPEWMTTLSVVAAPADAFNIDYLIGEESLTGRGSGTAMVGAFLAGSWRRYPDATKAIVDINAENVASWKLLERLGFHRVWTGHLESGHPSDDGISVIYELARPT